MAEYYAHHVIVTQDNPRNEDPYQIIQNVLSGMDNPNRVKIEMNRAFAILYAIQNAKPKDTILIAGKGHETHQIIQNVHYSLSDYQVAQDAIKSARESF